MALILSPLCFLCKYFSLFFMCFTNYYKTRIAFIFLERVGFEMLLEWICLFSVILNTSNIT